MSQSINIALLGAGNVGTQMGIALQKAGHTITEVFSASQESAGELAKILQTKGNSDFDSLTKEADLYILCVSDDAAPTITEQLDLGEKLVVHTSGSLPMDILNKSTSNYGVLYPLQTLSKKKNIHFKKEVPLCIEANNEETLKTLQALADSISEQVSIVDSEKRLYLHLAAVIVNNFSNYLYGIAEKVLQDQNISFDLLKPLIQETAAKIQEHTPKEMQTGPAVRNDLKTMQKHLELLEKYREIHALYKQISYSISEPHRLNQN